MKVWRMVVLSAALVMPLTLMPGQARAENKKGPCRQDAERLCPDMKPGPESFQECLKKHAAELSPACKEQLSKLKAGLSQFQKACGSDVKSFCADVKPGGGKIVRCLQQHEEKLSPACKDEVAKFRSRGGAPAPAAKQ
jgi:hypothetical protein